MTDLNMLLSCFREKMSAGQRPMVPVVMGGADYADIVPERSVIDVRDFEGPADLARYKNERGWLPFSRVVGCYKV